MRERVRYVNPIPITRKGTTAKETFFLLWCFLSFFLSFVGNGKKELSFEWGNRVIIVAAAAVLLRRGRERGAVAVTSSPSNSNNKNNNNTAHCHDKKKGNCRECPPFGSLGSRLRGAARRPSQLHKWCPSSSSHWRREEESKLRQKRRGKGGSWNYCLFA